VLNSLPTAADAAFNAYQRQEDPSEVSLSQVHNDIIYVSLFYSHFSLRTSVCNEKITAVGHAVDHSVGRTHHAA